MHCIKIVIFRKVIGTELTQSEKTFYLLDKGNILKHMFPLRLVAIVKMTIS